MCRTAALVMDCIYTEGFKLDSIHIILLYTRAHVTRIQTPASIRYHGNYCVFIGWGVYYIVTLNIVFKLYKSTTFSNKYS